MSKAKVGTGHLTPFKKGSTDSESVPGSTAKEHEKEGCMHHVNIEKATRRQNELTAFKDHSIGEADAGMDRNSDTVPKFRGHRDCGIPYDEYQAFKE